MTVALLSLNGCQKEELEDGNASVLMSDIEVAFNSRIHARVLDNQWEEKDYIGVFMTSTSKGLSEESIVNGSYNMKYVFSSGSFISATGNDQMFYPIKGNVDFIAYYPYKAVSNFKLNLDVTRQQNLSAIDLLFSENLKNIAATKAPQTLVFDHKLSCLNFKIRAGEGVKKEDLKNISLIIKDIPSKVAFDLTNGALLADESSKKDIAALVADTLGAAIVYPGPSSSKAVSVVLPSGEYNFEISPESEPWASGFRYVYTLVLSKNMNTPVLKAEITPWQEGKGEELDNSESDVAVIPWDGKTSETGWYASESNEFILSKASEFAGFSELVNSGVTFEGKKVILARDLNLNGHPFPVIGEGGKVFAGVLDGASHRVSGYVPKMEEKAVMAALVGTNKGTIRNLVLSGNVQWNVQQKNPETCLGSFAGYNEGEIEGCRNYVHWNVVSGIVSEEECKMFLGGIVGKNSGNIKNCQNYGSLNYNPESHDSLRVNIGGIVGRFNAGKIEHCENNQNLTALGSYVYIGGICGEREADTGAANKDKAFLSACSNYGDIVVENGLRQMYAGGIAGNLYTYTEVVSCTNNGIITCGFANEDSGFAYAGGVSGRITYSVIKGCHNAGIIKGKTVGGIVGYVSTNSEIHTSTNATEASAELLKGGLLQGGIVGSLQKNSVVYGCNENLGSPKKWIGSAKGNGYKEGVTTSEHVDD